MKKGYWNGEHTATFECVEYTVGVPDMPTWWSAKYVNQVRQAVRITYGGETWLIDNEHGDGYYKVTKGQGSPHVGHKSVSNPTNIVAIPEEKWKTEYDVEGMKKEEADHDEWQRINYPENYERVQALKRTLAAHQAKYPR